jgi:hypothetical protein
MIELQKIPRRFAGQICVVAAPGPSLTKEVAELCRGQKIIAVNGAYRLLPFADILYACDDEWWELFYTQNPNFCGEKWSSHHDKIDPKIETARKFGLNLIRGEYVDGFSLDPTVIHYGGTSGFQAINLAILLGASPILLVGFDMRTTQQRHFHEDYPVGMKNGCKYEYFIPAFIEAAINMPAHIKIINCTPGSALTCFPMMSLREALGHSKIAQG